MCSRGNAPSMPPEWMSITTRPSGKMRVLTKFAMREEIVPRGITGKGAVHVDAIQRRSACAGNARALTQLRHQHQRGRSSVRGQDRAQPFQTDLPLIFISVSTAETDHAVRVRPSFPIDDSQRN